MSISRSKKTACGIAAIGVSIAVGCLLSIWARNRIDPPGDSISLHYSLLVQNTTNQPVKNARLSVAVPIERTAFQQCTGLEASHPFSLEQGEAGNQSLQFKWEMIPPLSTKIIKIETGLDVWRKHRPVEGLDPGSYLNAEPYIESDNRLIKNLAHKLKGPTAMATADNIHRWVAENIEYPGYIQKTRGALYAARHKKGDCTEFAALFVALCRASGIPSRFMGGFICPRSMVLDMGAYHNWAEFHVDGRWHLADPQRNNFMRDEWSYIAFQVIRTATGREGFMISHIQGQGLKVKLKT